MAGCKTGVHTPQAALISYPGCKTGLPTPLSTRSVILSAAKDFRGGRQWRRGGKDGETFSARCYGHFACSTADILPFTSLRSVTVVGQTPSCSAPLRSGCLRLSARLRPLRPPLPARYSAAGSPFLPFPPSLNAPEPYTLRPSRCTGSSNSHQPYTILASGCTGDLCRCRRGQNRPPHTPTCSY